MQGAASKYPPKLIPTDWSMNLIKVPKPGDNDQKVPMILMNPDKIEILDGKLGFEGICRASGKEKLRRLYAKACAITQGYLPSIESQLGSSTTYLDKVISGKIMVVRKFKITELPFQSAPSDFILMEWLKFSVYSKKSKNIENFYGRDLGLDLGMPDAAWMINMLYYIDPEHQFFRRYHQDTKQYPIKNGHSLKKIINPYGDHKVINELGGDAEVDQKLDDIEALLLENEAINDRVMKKA